MANNLSFGLETRSSIKIFTVKASKNKVYLIIVKISPLYPQNLIFEVYFCLGV